MGLAVTREEIRKWLKEGIDMGATHMIVVWDSFDTEDGDYPVYVMLGENVREKDKECCQGSMQRVMEVYSLSLDIEEQLEETRAFHYE